MASKFRRCRAAALRGDNFGETMPASGQQADFSRRRGDGTRCRAALLGCAYLPRFIRNPPASSDFLKKSSGMNGAGREHRICESAEMKWLSAVIEEVYHGGGEKPACCAAPRESTLAMSRHLLPIPCRPVIAIYLQRPVCNPWVPPHFISR